MNHLPITLDGAGDWAKLGGQTGELHGPAISIQAVGAGAGAVELYGGTDDIPIERRVLLGATDASGNLLISSAWGAHWVKATSGAAVVHYASGPSVSSSGGGAVTIADGASVALGSTSDTAYTDATGGTPSTVSSLLRGLFVKISVLLTGQGAQATSALQAKMAPMKPPLDVLSSASVTTSPAAVAVTAGAQYYLCSTGSAVGVAFRNSSSTSGITTLAGMIAVPGLESGGVVVEAPAGATHMIYIGQAACDLTYGQVQGA